MRLRSGILISALAVALAGLLGNDPASVGVAWPGRAAAVSSPHPVWRAVRWPSALDECGRGRAFASARADCGTEINLYLRAKVGFCNCATGVADNDDLDRVGDVKLFSNAFAGLTDGHPVEVGRMQGRSRLYHVAIPYAAPRDMWAI